jgi:hypothetical protein
MTDNFYVVSEDTITDFSRFWQTYSIAIQIQFVGAKKQKAIN